MFLFLVGILTCFICSFVWTEVNRIELDWIEWDGIVLNWIELNWTAVTIFSSRWKGNPEGCGKQRNYRMYMVWMSR
jgi:hypothetical protein